MKNYGLQTTLILCILCLSLEVYASNKYHKKPLVINGVQFEMQQNNLDDYRQTIYYALLPKFDTQLYLTISDEAFSGHVASRKWSGTLNGVNYVKRAEFLSMLELHPNVTDVYERFVFRLDEDAYAELSYDGVGLRYMLTEKQEPYLLKKYHNAKTWAKCFWMMLRMK